MKRSRSGLWAVILGSTLLTTTGCGSSYGGGEGGSTYESSDLSQLARERSRRAHVTDPDAAAAAGAASVTDAATPPATGPAATAATPPAGGSSATPTDIQAVISAAQSPDGTAIPQGPGPDGQCPQVLVLLGFWSCPQIGQTCTYASAGVGHNCACYKLSGEGGLPAWVCDQ